MKTQLTFGQKQLIKTLKRVAQRNCAYVIESTFDQNVRNAETMRIQQQLQRDIEYVKAITE
jgi:hypothetical protein